MGKQIRPLSDTTPIKFKRWVQWDLGYFNSFWGRFRVRVEPGVVVVAKLRPWPQPPEWEVRFHPVTIYRPLLCGETAVVSKWIRAAVEKSSKKKPGQLMVDPVLHSGREALRDFMTEVDAGQGRVREPSVLMIACDEGRIRVGLKDDDAGGWCWREGITLEEALDALEKALQTGDGVFRSQRVVKGKKGR